MFWPCVECDFRYGRHYTEECDKFCDYAKYAKNEEIDRKTALSILQDLSHKMRPSSDIFGNKTLEISRSDFEAIRKKYLDEE